MTEELEDWMRCLGMLVMQAPDDSEDELFFHQWWEELKPFVV
jgi:hypothetical protein